MYGFIKHFYEATLTHSFFYNIVLANLRLKAIIYTQFSLGPATAFSSGVKPSFAPIYWALFLQTLHCSLWKHILFCLLCPVEFASKVKFLIQKQLYRHKLCALLSICSQNPMRHYFFSNFNVINIHMQSEGCRV